MAKQDNSKFDLLTNIKMTDVEREALNLDRKNRSLRHYMIIAIIISLGIGFTAGIIATYTGVSASKAVTTVEVEIKNTADPKVQ